MALTSKGAVGKLLFLSPAVLHSSYDTNIQVDSLTQYKRTTSLRILERFLSTELMWRGFNLLKVANSEFT